MGEAAKRGHVYSFLGLFHHQVEAFNAGQDVGKCVFAIGNALCGHFDEKSAFESDYRFDVKAALRAVEFYKKQVVASRKAVDAWTGVAIRLEIVQDVRYIIAKIIWDSRKDALFI
jgi:hypothetical protein